MLAIRALHERRLSNAPIYRHYGTGFRIARTFKLWLLYPLSHETVMIEAEVLSKRGWGRSTKNLSVNSKLTSRAASCAAFGDADGQSACRVVGGVG
jgi:hypothetical protein